MEKINKKNGFTLLELLLVVALMGILAVVAAPMYLSLQAENEMNITSVTIGDIIRKTQLKSQSVDNNSSWGIKIKTGALTVFKGENFSTRDQSFDEEISITNSVAVSSLTEIIFSPLIGTPNIVGVVKLEHTDGRKSQLTINSLGVVSIP